MKPTLSSAFSNFLLGQQTVPTCANRRHSCLSRHRGGETKRTMREKETDRMRETWFQHSIRETFSPQFSLLQCQNCCTCRYLLCLTLCLWHKMSALIRQNKFLVNTEGGETVVCSVYLNPRNDHGTGNKEVHSLNLELWLIMLC